MKNFCKIFKYIILQHILTLIYPGCYGYGYKKSINTADMLTNDNLLNTRCRSKCFNQKPKDCQTTCIKDYLENSAYKKYGDCPNEILNDMDNICLNTCHSIDYKCRGIQKCCSHSCGMTCIDPVGLEKIEGLPPVPYSLKVTETRKNVRTAEIKWDIFDTYDGESPMFIVVESRSHIGVTFAEYKFNEWHLHMPLDFIYGQLPQVIRYIGRIKLKPGRWYQFRVAAVNAMGTQGYSYTSKEFQLSLKPKPPKPPNNVTVGPLIESDNNTYSRLVLWSAPRSDLPIERYKICWSLYLKEDDKNKTSNESLLKESAIVPEPIRQFEITALKPNSIYFIQIQAISVFGKKRLRSDTESTIMNTSLTENTILTTEQNLANILEMNESFKNTKSGTRNGRAGAIQIRFVYRKGGLVVSASWGTKAYQKYKLTICRGSKDVILKKPMGNSHQDILLRKNSYDIPNLKFGITYTIGLKYTHKKSPAYDVIKTFTTPICENFKKRYPNKATDIKCSNAKRHKS